jgi:GT2 family glycosyltransferase
MSPSSILIHRDMFDAVGLFDESLPACEDYDLWLRITAHFPVLFVDEPLILKYGGHDDQLSRRHWGMDRFRIYALEKILASGLLGEEDRAAAAATCAAKATVVANGARKRGKHELATYYQEISERHATHP